MSAPLHDLTSSNGGASPDHILDTVSKLVAEVIGEGYDLDLEITRDTSFSDDIELESIEFVALGEMLLEVYGDRVDLVAWFSELDVDQIIGLTVGQLVDFVAESLGSH